MEVWTKYWSRRTEGRRGILFYLVPSPICLLKKRPHVHTSIRPHVTSLVALLTALSILAAGCDLVDLPIEVEPAPSQLVVSSVMGSDQSLFVTVSRSFSALSATDADSLSSDFIGRLLVDSAGVLLHHGARSDTLFKLFDIPGLYVGLFPELEPYQQLDLTVHDSLTGETISAATKFIPPVALEAVSLTEEISERDDTTTVLTYRFEDPPGENYYVLHAYDLPSSGVLDSLFIDDELNPALRNDEAVVFYETLITDRAFADAAIADTVRIPFTSVNDTIAVSLSHVSEGYFRFLDARRRTGGLVSSLANEPVNHPTNVIGGLGFFSAHQPRVVVIEKSK